MRTAVPAPAVRMRLEIFRERRCNDSEPADHCSSLILKSYLGLDTKQDKQPPEFVKYLSKTQNEQSMVDSRVFGVIV